MSYPRGRRGPRSRSSARRQDDGFAVRPAQNRVNVNPRTNIQEGTVREPMAPPGPELALRTLEDWRSWPEVTVTLSSVPNAMTTWDLWQEFSKQGTITLIEILSDKQERRNGRAKIVFRPAPRRAFWEDNQGWYPIPGPGEEEGQDGQRQVFVGFEKKKKRFEVQSPIRKSIWYPDRMSLAAAELDFGVMLKDKVMMRMFTAKPSSDDSDWRTRGYVTFGVNLLRREIVGSFTCELKQRLDDGGATTKAPAGEFDRVDQYRFAIPFGPLRKIHITDNQDNSWSLILDLKHPPEVLRKRRYIMDTHSDDSNMWTEMDCWYRMTDIVYNPNLLKKQPVSYNKMAEIDIGRWTTYRFTFNKEVLASEAWHQIRSAIQDFNIDIVDDKDFKTEPGKPAPMWSVIDEPDLAAHHSTNQILSSIHPDEDYRLPFEVRYQLEVCVSRNILHEHNITPEFLRKLSTLARENKAKARSILEYAVEKEKRMLDPVSIFTDSEAWEYAPKTKIPKYCALTRKATVTPTNIYYSSPTIETSNRVIRKYKDYEDRFLRVQFLDELSEDKGRIGACANKKRLDEVYARVFRTLLNGITIGDRHFEFLAYGNSQFREKGAYFFSPTKNLSCADIRTWMGDFRHIPIVAKYAARLGQCFSTTRAMHTINAEIVAIPDVEREFDGKKYVFTDGVGRISEVNAQMIAAELNFSTAQYAPSAFQFRLAGCKGILAVSPEAKRQEIHIRPSQEKFKAKFKGLEIIKCANYSPATLNRQTILIFSALGVKDEVFLDMLSEQLSEYEQAMTDKSLAMQLLGRYVDDARMTVVMSCMLQNGFGISREPFVTSLLHLWRSWSIKLLKEKARITVEKAAFVLGCVDETATLRGHYEKHSKDGKPMVDDLPQIFLQIPEKAPDGTIDKSGRYQIITGVCVLGRNPSLHPGDIRVVQAIDVPALHHLRDVVVFPQTGDRDVPSMCSGGDLDGDDFFVIWDEKLLPTEWNVAPMDYSAPKPKPLDRDVVVTDLMKFFVRHMKNDSLGSIAVAHLAQADFLDQGVKSPTCIELARLHSKAVDYVKTGEPAEMPKKLRPRMWPHFMEKNISKDQIYHSPKILGQVYDRIQQVDFAARYEDSFDPRVLKAYELDDEILAAARQVKSQYDTAMRRIMAQHEVKTEFEVWSTFMLSKPRGGSDYKFQEDMARISNGLKDGFRDVCLERAGASDARDFEKLGPFVAAMYRVTCEEMQIALQECQETKRIGGRDVPRRKKEPKHMPFMSFPWLFHDVLGQIATGTEQLRDLERFGISVQQPSTSRPKVSHGFSGNADMEDGPVVRTAAGIVHRGEMIDLFGPGDDEEAHEHLSEDVDGELASSTGFTPGEATPDEVTEFQLGPARTFQGISSLLDFTQPAEEHAELGVDIRKWSRLEQLAEHESLTENTVPEGGEIEETIEEDEEEDLEEEEVVLGADVNKVSALERLALLSRS